MADGTNIEWTEATWNPIRAVLRSGERIGWHCEHASPGCANCYSEKFNLAGRSVHTGTRLPYKPGHRKDVDIYLDEKKLLEPLRWRRARQIFVCSMTDLFAEFVTDDMLDRVFAVMALCPQHTFQVLTKRSARMRQWFAETWQGTVARDIEVGGKTIHIPAGGATGRMHQVDEACSELAEQLGLLNPNLEHLWTEDGKAKCLQWAWPLANVWLGVSVEDQQRADERIPDLLTTPAAVRWLSCEPLLGAVDLTRICKVPQQPGSIRAGIHINALAGRYYESGMRYIGEWDINAPYPEGAPALSLDWIVAGGESGPNARPMHPDWARSLRDQCAAAGVPFFFKQWGEFVPATCMDNGDGLGAVCYIEDGSEKNPDFKGSRPITVLGGQEMWRIGKKAAGRLLDGVEHNGMPAVAHSNIDRTSA